MENTTQTKLSFSKLRIMMKTIHESIFHGYLIESWKDDKINNYENIVNTYHGYYAMMDDCISINDEYYHESMDSDDIIFDEIDEEYILESDSVNVYTGSGSFYTHMENACHSHNIYRYDGDWITDSYMEMNGLIFDVDGDIMHIDDVYYWECDGEYHSEPEPEDDEEDEIEYDENGNELPYIHNYSHRPSMKFHKINFENENAPFLGIELEVERKNSNGLKHRQMAGLIQHDHWYFKTDGSLTDGFEIVTHPMTFNYIKRYEKTFDESLKKLIENGYNSYDANTCGMHIHISKKCFNTWHLYRFLKFFVENKDFIIAISQRKIEKLKKWANIEDDNDSSLIYKAKKKEGNSERYVAINLKNSQTIEIRIFRGTLNFNSYMKNIEFAHGLFMYTKENKDISLDGFKSYIESSCDYSNLKKFINLKNL